MRTSKNHKYNVAIGCRSTGGTGILVRCLKMYKQQGQFSILFESGDLQDQIKAKVSREFDLLLSTTGFDMRNHCIIYQEDIEEDAIYQINL